MNSSTPDKERLARFNVGQRTDPGVGYTAATDLWHALVDTERTKYTDGPATHEDVTHEDLAAALRLLPDVRSFLDITERDILAAWMDQGWTWAGIAEELGYSSGDAVRQRYRRLGGTRTWSAGRPAEREPEPESFFASREQVAQWRAETLDRLAAHPEIVATPEQDTPGYWVLRTPQGDRLGEEITRTITDLRDRGVRVQRPDGSELRGDLRNWSHENARARQWEKEQQG